MVNWATRQVHRDRMDEFRPHLLKLGFVELTEGVFRDLKRCIDFYPSIKIRKAQRRFLLHRQRRDNDNCYAKKQRP